MKKDKDKKNKIQNTKNPKESVIVCRCWDVNLSDVEAIVDGGITDPEEVKRFLHIGMGPCQGRTCGRIVARIIAMRTAQSLSEIQNTTQRPPLVALPIRVITGEEGE